MTILSNQRALACIYQITSINEMQKNNSKRTMERKYIKRSIEGRYLYYRRKHLLILAQSKRSELALASIISIHMYRQKILLALIFPLFDRHYPFLPYSDQSPNGLNTFRSYLIQK